MSENKGNTKLGKFSLKVRVNFCILTLETLHPKGTSRELNRI